MLQALIGIQFILFEHGGDLDLVAFSLSVIHLELTFELLQGWIHRYHFRNGLQSLENEPNGEIMLKYVTYSVEFVELCTGCVS